MTLIKTSILSFIATAIKILSGLVINKAVAVYIGPAGLALVGQFQNFSQLVMTVAQGAINTGVTKYTAEYGKDEHDSRIPILFSTASKISLVSSVVVGAGIVLFSQYASLQLLKSEQYTYIFVIFGFTIILFVINNLLLSILNGLTEIKTYIAINIIQSLYSLVFTTLLIVSLGLDGALIALVANQSVILLIVLWMLRKHHVIKLDNFKGAFDKPEAKKLMSFAAMAIIAASTVPISHLIVREYIAENTSWEVAGYWSAIWNMSTMYMMVITTTITTYYLPKISELQDKVELRKEILKVFIFVVPIMALMCLTIYVLKEFIVILIFTKEFLPMLDFFIYQLVGDFLKIIGFIFSYYLIAKAKTLIYIFKEIAIAILFTIFSVVMVKPLGVLGVFYAYIFTAMLHNFVVVFFVEKDLRQKSMVSHA
jgi:polysaccharide transporter, PST family